VLLFASVALKIRHGRMSEKSVTISGFISEEEGEEEESNGECEREREGAGKEEIGGDS